MKRMKFLFGQRRMQVLLTLAVLLLAASVVIGSGASFTSTSANPLNTFTAGILRHSNSKPNAAVLTAGPMMPGDPASTGTVIITNTGDGAADFTLSRSAITDNITAPGTAPLSETLDLLIKDNLGNTTYTGKLGDFPLAGVPAGKIGASSARTYTFSVAFPDTDGAGPKGADNKYKLSESIVDFYWEAVSN